MSLYKCILSIWLFLVVIFHVGNTCCISCFKDTATCWFLMPVHILAFGYFRRNALNEVYAHAVLGKHVHIVGYYSAWAEHDHMFIQNEYCSGKLILSVQFLQNESVHVIGNFINDASLLISQE